MRVAPFARVRLGAVVVVVATSFSGPISAHVSSQSIQPTFKGGVELVRVSAVVTDQKGRPVTNLSQRDFVLMDAGKPRPISDFRLGVGDLTIGLLLDVSGSMQVADRVVEARRAADHLLAWLAPGRDEVALFSFDSALHELAAFTTDLEAIRRGLAKSQAYGTTSLHDAIAQAARRVAASPRPQRALVVLTDGVDTSSRLGAPEVSGIASAIDVPVYIMAVVAPVDRPDAEAAAAGATRETIGMEGVLSQLARWTGGELFVMSAPSEASLAARQIVAELRHQYLIAFEPSSQPGWHPLEVRARDKDHRVRARSGYFAGPLRPAS